MALLNPMDPLRQAWNVDIPGNFFTSIPTPEMRTSDMEVCSIMAIYMGIEDPFLVDRKKLVFRGRDSTGGPLFRTVDTFGDSLSMYLGTGHGRFTLHNELEDLFHRIVLLVGMNACRQPIDVFSPAIDPGRRTALHTPQHKAAKLLHRGGIIFDLFIRAFSLSSRNFGFVDQGYDWKTIGMTSKYDDGAPGCAADIRAAAPVVDQGRVFDTRIMATMEHTSMPEARVSGVGSEDVFSPLGGPFGKCFFAF